MSTSVRVPLGDVNAADLGDVYMWAGPRGYDLYRAFVDEVSVSRWTAFSTDERRLTFRLRSGKTIVMSGRISDLRAFMSELLEVMV